MSKRHALIFLAIFSACFFFCRSNYASDEITGEEIKLYMGETKIIPVSNPTRVVIANPSIADVTDVKRTEMTLSPKAKGKTTLVLWDTFGEQSFQVKVFNEDISDAKRRIDNLLKQLNLPGVFTEAMEDEGKVMLLGRVKSSQERERISLALGSLKEKTVDVIEIKEEEGIIDIDVQLLELSEDATKTLGLTWPGSVNLIEKGSRGIADAGTKFSTLFKVLNFQRGTSSGASPFTFTLDALVQEGKARILSRPHLACQSGKEAELMVGGEKPVFTTQVASAGGEGTEVEYKEYGIKLKIKPVISEAERIKLGLSVEVSEVGAAETIGSSTTTTAKAYPLTKRNASTELFLNDGQTLAIGGLIKQKTEEDVRKAPVLGDVPVLGLLFRKKTTKVGGGQGERGNTELFITLTPRIISPSGIATEERVAVMKQETPAPLSRNYSSDAMPTDPIGYAQVIQKRLLGNLTYPAAAKVGGLQGTVKLSLHLSYLGELLEAKIISSSGHQNLDDHALSVARNIPSYPPFPEQIKEKDLWVDIPVSYVLD